MRLTATKEFTFDSCHFLPGHEGLCANMHGHTYKLQVTIERRNTQNRVVSNGPSAGMVMDFSDLKKIVKKAILDIVDHKNLNEVLPYRPTAENMAMDFAARIDNALPGGVVCARLRLWETPTSFAEVER